MTPDKTAPDLIVNNPDTVYFEVAKVPYGLRFSKIFPSVKSCLDLVDGNLIGSVSIDTSLVQTTVVGIYPVIYTSSDISGNKATVYRYVDVIDTIKPILTLKGSNPDTIVVTTPFVDPGVTVSAPNGYLTQVELQRHLHVTSNINDSVVGTYKVTYSLTDTFGNVAVPVTRTVNVVGMPSPPVLTLIGGM